jgi:hypothetical protein
MSNPVPLPKLFFWYDDEIEKDCVGVHWPVTWAQYDIESRARFLDHWARLFSQEAFGLGCGMEPDTDSFWFDMDAIKAKRKLMESVEPFEDAG